MCGVPRIELFAGFRANGLGSRVYRVQGFRIKGFGFAA